MVIKVARGVANALAYLHYEYDAMPIIHGDVKPSNILLDSEFEAHLADFGLAKLASSNLGDVSASSNLKGSIGYMAPEYAYAAKVSTKVDVYSFGVVVLEMMSGRRPHNEGLQGVSLHEWFKGKLLQSSQYSTNYDVGFLDNIVHTALSISATSTHELAVEDSTKRLLLQMAVTCTEELPNKRPTMQHIKTFLESLQL